MFANGVAYPRLVGGGRSGGVVADAEVGAQIKHPISHLRKSPTETDTNSVGLNDVFMCKKETRSISPINTLCFEYHSCKSYNCLSVKTDEPSLY